MPILRKFFAVALLGLSLSVGAVQGGDPPSAEAVQQSLDTVSYTHLTLPTNREV